MDKNYGTLGCSTKEDYICHGGVSIVLIRLFYLTYWTTY